MIHRPEQWFRPKRFGIGWSPATWEGWLATLLLAGAAVAVFRWLR